MDKKERICFECKKIVKNSQSNICCRKCWLKIRDKEDRYLDHLFCKDKQNTKKTEIIEPVYDIGGNNLSPSKLERT